MIAPGGQTLSGHVSGGSLDTIRLRYFYEMTLKCQHANLQMNDSFSEGETGMLLLFKISLRDQVLVLVM